MFVQDGIEITRAKTIADKFNQYFTESWPKLARSIDTAIKNPSNSYLTAPCATWAQVMTISLQNCLKKLNMSYHVHWAL